MKKAEEIVATIFTIVNYPKDIYNAYDICIEAVQRVLDKKCEHPMSQIKVCNGVKSDWKCHGCDQEVVATKYEVAK